MSGGNENKIYIGLVVIGNDEALIKFNAERVNKEMGENCKKQEFESGNNLKRKRQNDNKTGKVKKKKKETCKECKREHKWVCLKGKNICYKCKQEGHNIPNYPSLKNKFRKKQEKRNACETYGKNHMGICLKETNVCYHCKRGGHIVSNCPELKKCVCCTCQEMGHLSKYCLRKGEKAERVKTFNDNKPPEDQVKSKIDYAMVFMANI